MTFNLKIELGNDGMQYSNDVADALDTLADKLRNRDLVTFEEMDAFDREGRIRDVNGNRVGDWKAA